jgi:hypothetical protein
MDYIKNQYIPRLTEERMGLYSAVNHRIYRHVAGAGGSQYISQLLVTGEYIPIYLSVRCTRGIYFCILGIDEYSDIYSSVLYSTVPSSVNQGIYIYIYIYLSVMKVCLSVITDKRVCVSCSARHRAITL